MFRIMIMVITLLLLSTMSLGQATGSSDQETIRLLVQQVKELQEKVQVLEAAQSGSAVAAAQPTAQHEVAEQPTISSPSAATPPGLHELGGIQWRGFGEVTYKVLDQRQPELSTFGSTPGSSGNFYTGDFSLFLTSRINDKASVLSEITFSEQREQLFEVDLERVLFKYDYSDHLRMSFGRYQTGIGYYNTQYHGGRWFLTTVDRPLITEYTHQGGPLPTQAMGISTTGLIPSGKLGLNYILEYGSSDTNRPHLDGSPGGDDESNGNHVNIGLFARPDAIPGLQIGGSFYHDKISNVDVHDTGRFGQTIVNAHVIYVGHGVEFLNEGFLIRHTEQDSTLVFNMPAFYSQFSKRFGRTRPFFRYQYLNANPNSVFEDILLRYGPSFGARYDLNDNFALKAQLDHTLRKGKPDLNGLQLQLTFAF